MFYWWHCNFETCAQHMRVYQHNFFIVISSLLYSLPLCFTYYEMLTEVDTYVLTANDGIDSHYLMDQSQ